MNLVDFKWPPIIMFRVERTYTDRSIDPVDSTIVTRQSPRSIDRCTHGYIASQKSITSNTDCHIGTDERGAASGGSDPCSRP